MSNLKKTILKIINEELNLLAGGKSRGMSLKDVATKHNVPLSVLEKQMKIGKKIEMEHTTRPDVAYEIAKDHLFEIPDYYTRLVKMEHSYEEKSRSK